MQPNENDVIGILGAGIVGGSLLAWLRSQDRDVRVYDPAKGHGDMTQIDPAAIVFVCVPTPYTAGVGFDDSHLLDAVHAISGRKLVVIKSTVLPGTTELLQARFPQHRFMFNPEFLREATAAEDLVTPDRQIIGCTPQSEPDAVRVMQLLPRAPYERICTASEAEMAKYVANSFLAVKVIFANEIFDLCDRMEMEYAPVRDMVAADVRIGGSHMDVFDAGYRGYGGKCLPKDSKSLLDLARSFGAEMQVLGAADRVNERLRGAQASPGRIRMLDAAAAAVEERAA